MKKLIPFLLMLLSATGAYAQQPAVTGVPCFTTVSGGTTTTVNTITAGGVAQTLIVGANGIKGFQLQNIDTSEPLWISWTGTAAAGASDSYAIPAATASTFAGAGSYYSNLGFTNTITVVGATTGHKFSCTRW